MHSQAQPEAVAIAALPPRSALAPLSIESSEAAGVRVVQMCIDVGQNATVVLERV